MIRTIGIEFDDQRYQKLFEPQRIYHWVFHLYRYIAIIHSPTNNYFCSLKNILNYKNVEKMTKIAEKVMKYKALKTNKIHSQ